VSAVKVSLPPEIFGVEVNIPLIHQVVVAQLAAARQGTHATKTRGMVSGGGRKPYKQKGTGRARQGSTRAPQFTGGGVVHGPQPRDYSQRTPKKMKAAALRGALSDRATNGRIHVVESLATGDKPSTKAALASLRAIVADRRKFLIVLERTDSVAWLSLRNVPEVHVVAVDQLNTYDVLESDDVVFTKGAYEAFLAVAPKGKPAEVKAKPAPAKKVAAKKAPAKVEQPAKVVPAKVVAETDSSDDVAVTKTAPVAAGVKEPTALPQGAKAPLKSGKAPKGYEVKGNADSGLYHEPGSRWYDATEAEFWFKSAEDAETAGFKKAGSKKESGK
jgi:large subunit ribosomal protein L4